MAAAPADAGIRVATAIVGGAGQQRRARRCLPLHGDGGLAPAAGAPGRRVYTRGEGEFWDLDAEPAATRRGCARASPGSDCNGWPLHGFVAPAWLLGPGAWQALRAPPSRYTATLRHLHLLPDGGRIASQASSTAASNAWRRAGSVAWAGTLAATAGAQPGAADRAASARCRPRRRAPLVAAPARTRAAPARRVDGHAGLRALAGVGDDGDGGRRRCRRRIARCARAPRPLRAD